MTLKRSVVSFFTWFLLLPVLSGQPDLYGDTAHSPAFLVITLAADTVHELEIPNFFTPNNDGINDHFEVATDGTTVYEFSIFTRTGVRIYFSRSPSVFWDGRSMDGMEYPEGVYYYVIEETVKQEDPLREAGIIHLFR